MANFHSNVLAISASEQDMCKVLWRIAENLNENSGTTEFDISGMESTESARDLYRDVASTIGSHYWLCFCESSSVSPLSDSAAVGMIPTSLGYTLFISYSTAWESNDEDISAFFRSLPAGNYGVTLLDADEEDWYETINMFCGLHRGGKYLRSAKTVLEDAMYEQADLLERHNATDWDAIRESSDLALVSQHIALAQWNDWHDEEGEDIEDENECPLPLADRRPRMRALSKKRIERILDTIREITTWTPYVFEIRCKPHYDSSAAVGNLLAGDLICFEGTWDASDDCQPITFTAKALNGKIIGDMGPATFTWPYALQHPEEFEAALFALLPHMKARLWSSELVTAATCMKRGVDHRLYCAEARLDLEPIDLNRVLAEAEELLAKPECERFTSSVTTEE